MNTTEPTNNITILSQAAAYKAYLSLMPQIHHKTVNMSHGATSAEPLKSNHPLDHGELIRKADELICMHFGNGSNDGEVDKEEARKATRFAADQLFHHLGPKHNDHNLSPKNSMDNSQHGSPKSSFSSRIIISPSSSDSSNRTLPNQSLSQNDGVTSQHHSMPLHPTTNNVDDSIPFERAVLGDAANPNTQNLSIDSIPAQVDDSSESSLVAVITPAEEAQRPTHHIGGIHKIQTAILNQGLPTVESSNARNSNVPPSTDINSSVGNSKSKEESIEEPRHLEQSVTRDVSSSRESLSDMNIPGNSLNQDEVNGKGFTEDDKDNKDLSLSRDVALAGNAISVLGLSSNLNQTPMDYQATPNTDKNDTYNNAPNTTGANTMTGYKIRNKHSKLAGHIGPKDDFSYNQLPLSNSSVDAGNEMTNRNNLQHFSNSDDNRGNLEGESNPVVTERDAQGINEKRPVDWDKINQNRSVSEIV